MGEARWAPKADRRPARAVDSHLDLAKDVKGNVEDGVAEIRTLLDRFNELSMNYSDETADEFSRVQGRPTPATAGTSTRRSSTRWMRCAARRPTPT